MNDLSESLLLRQESKEENETQNVTSSRRLNSNLLTPLSMRMKEKSTCFNCIAAFATSVPFLAFAAAFMVSSERVYFKVMTDKMSRYRYVLAQFMILCNLILSTVVVVTQKMYRECTCDCDEDSDDDETFDLVYDDGAGAPPLHFTLLPISVGRARSWSEL